MRPYATTATPPPASPQGGHGDPANAPVTLAGFVRRPRVLATTTRLALLTLAILGLLDAVGGRRPYFGGDFYHFWVVGIVAREGLSPNFYAPEEQVRLAGVFAERVRPHTPPLMWQRLVRYPLDLTATPLLYMTFTPFSTLPYATAWRTYQFLSLLLGVAAVILLGELFQVTVENTLLLIALLGWGIVDLLRCDVNTGNVNALQLLGFALLTWIAGGRRWTHWRGVSLGALLGLLLLFKPNFWPVVPILGVWCITERTIGDILSIAGGALAVGAAALGATAAFFGSMRVWQHWLDAARAYAARKIPTTVALDQGFNQWWLNRTGQEIWMELTLGVFAIVVLTVAAAIFLRLREARDSHRPGPADNPAATADRQDAAFRRFSALLGVGLIGSLICGPHIWLHYYLMALIPALAWLGTRANAGERAGSLRTIARPVLTLIGLCTLGLAGSGSGFANLVGAYYAERWTAVRLAGLAILFAIAVAQLWTAYRRDAGALTGREAAGWCAPR